MSSALTHEQCEILRDVAAGRLSRPVPGFLDMQLLQRAGLIIEVNPRRRFRITEAGKRYVAFIERARLSPGIPQLPADVHATQLP